MKKTLLIMTIIGITFSANAQEKGNTPCKPEKQPRLSCDFNPVTVRETPRPHNDNRVRQYNYPQDVPNTDNRNLNKNNKIDKYDPNLVSNGVAACQTK